MLSDDQKKQGVVSKLPGGSLPGLGGKPSLGPLPGLGGKPGGALPGLGGRPGAGVLPGMKPVGGALPGMKPGAALAPSKPVAAPAPVVPAFLQPKQPQQASAAQQQAEVARAAAIAAEQRILGSLVQTSNQVTPMAEGKVKKTVIYVAAISAIICIGIGTAFGTGLSARGGLNVAIRDAFVIEYELKEAGKLFNEVETVLNAALAKASKRKFDEAHIRYLKNSVAGNPLPPTIFTERNYKHFNAVAVDMLLDYYKRWDKLAMLIKEHIKATEADMEKLRATDAEAKKLIETTYGAIFKDQNGKLVANIAAISAGEGSKYKVPLDNSERELYNPEGEDNALTKDPEKYVVEIGLESKEGLLSNASQTQYKRYLKRVQEMGFILTGMGQIQKDLINKISRICSQDPSLGFGPNPEEGLAEYLQSRSRGGAGK